MRQLQDVVRENPADTKSLSLLGLAYQQLARETGDPAYYTKSEGVLDRALALEPLDLLATSGLGSLALARHEFRDALSLGLKATEISPGMLATTALWAMRWSSSAATRRRSPPSIGWPS